MKNKRNQDGFTLVELSIVLVIIGLIVSGVLVGQDMIRSAELRAAVKEIETYNTSVYAFRDKFGGLPGDLSNTKAAQFGFAPGTGANGRRDGDGRLEGCAATAAVYGCETALFWRDLSDAGLIANDYSTAEDGPGDNGAALIDLLPESDAASSHFVTVFTSGGRNWFRIADIDSINDTTGVYTMNNAMTPQTAFSIDDKMDDGNPGRGTTLASHTTGGGALTADSIVVDGTGGGATDPFDATEAATDCAYDANATAGQVSGVYNLAITNDWNEAPACQLSIRAAF